MKLSKHQLTYESSPQSEQKHYFLRQSQSKGQDRPSKYSNTVVRALYKKKTPQSSEAMGTSLRSEQPPAGREVRRMRPLQSLGWEPGPHAGA